MEPLCVRVDVLPQAHLFASFLVRVGFMVLIVSRANIMAATIYELPRVGGAAIVLSSPPPLMEDSNDHGSSHLLGACCIPGTH